MCPISLKDSASSGLSLTSASYSRKASGSRPSSRRRRARALSDRMSSAFKASARSYSAKASGTLPFFSYRNPRLVWTSWLAGSSSATR